MLNASEVYTSNFIAGLQPDPDLTITEWADTYRMLPKKSSAMPGRYRSSVTPYNREIMDCLSSSSDFERVVYMKCAQDSGGTEVGINWIGHNIHIAPGPMLMVQPTVEVAMRVSKQRLAPSIYDTPQLRALVKDPRARDSGNTLMVKEFPGGTLILTGANSAVGLRSMPIMKLFLDEVDGYPSDVEGEGDPVNLAIKRTVTFPRRKIFMVSTPTIAGRSRIEKLYKESDMRTYHVACPHCKGKQVLKFGDRDTAYGLKWDKDEEGNHLPDTARYVCELCEKDIAEYHKEVMLEGGEWIAENPGSKIAGFHISALYAPLGWTSWEMIVDEFVKAQGNPDLLKTWYNTVLGETWDDVTDKIDDRRLYDRREDYELSPIKSCVVTCAVDVQKNHIECEVKSWGKGEESWGITPHIINGAFLNQDTQNALDEFLNRKFPHESGLQLGIACTLIDSGGHYTQQVYDFVKTRQIRQIYACKGASTMGKPIYAGTSKLPNGVHLVLVGTDTAKDIIYGRLGFDDVQGYLHFNKNYDPEFFKQLVSEKIEDKNGKRRWILPPGKKNEALDLNVYNLAALHKLNPDWDKLEIAPDTGATFNQVYYTHSQDNCDPEIEVKSNLPLIICCDFKKNPMVWPIAQTSGGKVWVVDEIVVRHGNTIAMAKELRSRFKDHEGGFIIYGSAMGTVRSGTSKSQYALLIDMGFGQQRVKRVNPTREGVTDAVNNMLRDIVSDEVRLTYHPRCIMLKRDFEQAAWNEEGTDIDRLDFGRGNASDALGYFIEKEWPRKTARKNPNKKFYK